MPPSAAEAFRRRTELRYLLEVVLVVVRDYNRIMNSLNPEERALFRERIKILDKKIGPGLNKLHWTVKGLVDMFVSDCRIQASKLQMKVDEYKSANLSIKQNCEQIAQTLLIKLDPNRVYENTEFDDCQVCFSISCFLAAPVGKVTLLDAGAKETLFRLTLLVLLVWMHLVSL